MKEKIKTILLVVMMTVAMLSPVFIVKAAESTPGLNVCGDPEKEKAAVESLYGLRYDTFKNQPNPSEAYQKAIQDAMDNFKKNSCQLSDIFRQIAKITNFLIGAVGIFVVFKLIDAGFGLVISYGNESKVTGAKEAMTNAIIGLAIVLASFAVVNTIFDLFQAKIGGAPAFPFNLFK